jgi:pyrroline-5-carboxylate reductase
VQAAQNCDVLVVAVKPWLVATVLAEVAHVLTPSHTVVSVAAGVPIEK